jgi:hypothetical protein
MYYVVEIISSKRVTSNLPALEANNQASEFSTLILASKQASRNLLACLLASLALRQRKLRSFAPRIRHSAAGGPPCSKVIGRMETRYIGSSGTMDRNRLGRRYSMQAPIAYSAFSRLPLSNQFTLGGLYDRHCSRVRKLECRGKENGNMEEGKRF